MDLTQCLYHDVGQERIYFGPVPLSYWFKEISAIHNCERFLTREWSEEEDQQYQDMIDYFLRQAEETSTKAKDAIRVAAPPRYTVSLCSSYDFRDIFCHSSRIGQWKEDWLAIRHIVRLTVGEARSAFEISRRVLRFRGRKTTTHPYGYCLKNLEKSDFHLQVALASAPFCFRLEGEAE